MLRDIDHSGFKRFFQEEVGINLLNPLSFSDKDTAIPKAVWNFMACDNVFRVSPSFKTLQLDGDQAVPVRYRLSVIQTLHKEIRVEISGFSSHSDKKFNEKENKKQSKQESHYHTKEIDFLKIY